MRALLCLGLVFAGCGSPSTSGEGGASASSAHATAVTSGRGSSGGSPASVSAEAGAGGATFACRACGGACVDTENDPRHCGACGHACDAAKPLCAHGVCGAPLCDVQGAACPLDHLCCGSSCCPAWKICCFMLGVPTPACADADAGACPTTCSSCP